MPMTRTSSTPDDKSGVYVITVEGFLDPDWAGRLNGVQIIPFMDSEQPKSRLTGWMQDQAALHGVLSALNGLALPILEVRRVE